MDTPRIYDSEYRFCQILWDHEPVSSGELVRLCAQELNWKKSTTYTVIKRLAERGVLQTEHAVVSSLISREQVQQQESRDFVQRTFGGSLPGFLAAFTGGRRLTEDEAEQLRRIIDDYEEGRS